MNPQLELTKQVCGGQAVFTIWVVILTPVTPSRCVCGCVCVCAGGGGLTPFCSSVEQCLSNQSASQHLTHDASDNRSCVLHCCADLHILSFIFEMNLTSFISARYIIPQKNEGLSWSITSTSLYGSDENIKC